MVGPAVDCFSNPLGAVRFIFDKALPGNVVPPPDFGRSDWGVQDLFRNYVLDSGALPQVPEINSVPLDAIAANSLVRFRGMVQDMFNVEYYVGAFKDGATWRTNKYTDTAALPVGAESEMQIWDRRPLYCVPVPGENSWVKDAFATRGFQIPTMHMPPVTRESEKRHREACPSSSEPEEMETDNSEEKDSSERKRVCSGITSCANTNPSAQCDLDLNMPLGEKKLVPCLVKVYDGADSDLKLNDVVEFIGVLTFDPELSVPGEVVRESLDGVGPAFLEDDVSAHLPASKVPRLHCILHRKLSGHSLLSAIPALEARFNASSCNLKELRNSLLEGLSKVLGGDYLAAEYLLLHLLSQVHARVEPMAVGKLSLNLTGWLGGKDGGSSSLTIAVAQAIAALLPRSHLMPVSLESLNRGLIAPRKNYNNNRLTTGALQLAEGTHLTLDETALKAGQLTEIGLQNLHLLKNLMEWQKVEYDFEFYKMEMPTDVPVLILSSATSKLFPADVVVPLRPTAESSPLLVDQAELFKWRMYLSAARAAEHAIEPSMQKILEESLVTARQEDRSLGPEVFHRWLTMARLLSVSFGETALSLERWYMVRDLELRCAERLRSC